MLTPVKPIVNILTARIPVISDLAGRPVSLADVAQQFGIADTRFLTVVQKVLRLSNRLGDLGGTNVEINFGTFDLGGHDVRGAAPLSSVPPRPDPSRPGVPWRDNPLVTGLHREFLNDLTSTEDAGGDQFGLKFPILENPLEVFKMFLGQTVDLFRFRMPELKVGFSHSQYFPLPPLPVVGVRLGGSIEAAANFAFGVDTRGLELFVQGAST